MKSKLSRAVAVVVSTAALMWAQSRIDSQSSVRLAADTQQATSGGAVFTAPSGWSIRTSGSLVVLDPPETDSHLVIVDVKAVDVNATDADSAAKAAWIAWKPDFKRPLKVATPAAPRDGWEERKNFSYETSPNERAIVQAAALRAGSAWTVVLIDATEPTLEKRASPFSLIIQSLRPKGYERENFAGRKALPLDRARIGQMMQFVDSSMKKLGIPGVGLAFIDHGQVVYEGGMGLRELGKPEAVDANTLFMAASNTKGMTTLLLSRLADQHKLRWDQPVTELFPTFKLGDADTTRQVLVKHLVCACTGLPRQDLEWIFEFRNSTPESVMTLLGTMQPTSHFGEVFQYSNIMAAAAGYLGAHIYQPKRELGVAYDDAMQKLIFDPLGMKSTTFDMARALSGDHASAHGDDVDGHAAVADMAFNYSITPLRPAGAAWTSAHDLIRYVQLELARGKLPDGTRLVSEENLLMRRKPQIPVGDRQSYGMGLEIDNTWGLTVVHHGGSMAGFKSDIMFLPDYGVGAVILTNSDTGGMMLRPFMRRLLEIMFDGKPEAAADVDAHAASYRASLQKDRERLAVPPDGSESTKLAAHYHSAELGDLMIRTLEKRVVFDVGEWKSTVASRRNDDGSISFITIDPAISGLEFVVAQRDGKRALIMRDGQHEYVFHEA
jgi:CubicO group peptidase (beta-lactamase class C family)